MTIGLITDLNPTLPAVPTGALLVPAADSTPSYCLVTGSVITNPSTGKTANFGVAMPLTWNNKFLFSGGGGYCGVVFQSPPTDARGGGFPPDALAKGYAIAATDDGHANTPVGLVFDGTWALTAPGVAHEDAGTDFFSRAVHTVTVAGKQFVQHWYAGALARSYFVGCSDGGREGLVEATRYPEDFEGYIVGDPFFDVPGQILAGRAARALVDAPDSYLPPALLTLVDNAVYANCDAVDGVRDALIQNPGACSFSPQSLLCSGGNTADCLTQSQVDTLSAWFAAATDAQGRVVSLGFPVSDLYNNGAAGNNLFRWTARYPRRSPMGGGNVRTACRMGVLRSELQVLGLSGSARRQQSPVRRRPPRRRAPCGPGAARGPDRGRPGRRSAAARAVPRGGSQAAPLPRVQRRLHHSLPYVSVLLGVGQADWWL